MKFDAVHDLQNVYRKILKSMSRPGHIENIAAIGSKLNIEIATGKNMTALLLSLLDGEVSFSFAAKADKDAANKINQLTYAVQVTPERADYLVITAKAKAQEVAEVLKAARIGSLSDPHESATVVIEVQKLENSSGLILKGPGIKESTVLQVVTEHSWLTARNDKVSEFPLGIDLVLLDGQGNIVCLPRTTVIRQQEVV